MSPLAAAGLMRLVAVSFFLFGLIFASVAFAPLAAPGLFLLDLLKWPLDGDPAALSQEARWLSAIGGGVLAAFAVFMHMIVAPGLAREDGEIRRAAIAAILVWFVIDSAGSVAAGAASNAVFNAGFMALYLAPILLARSRGAAASRAA